MNHDNERRQHFRVADRARIELHLAAQATADLNDCFPVTDLERLQDALWQVDGQIDRAIEATTAELQTPLRLFADKLELLAQATLQNRDEGEAIELSEAGISLFRPERLADGGQVALRLQLLPEGVTLRCAVRLIHQTPCDAGWHIGLAFESLTETQSERLSRHLFRRQAQQRRAQHEG